MHSVSDHFVPTNMPGRLQEVLAEIPEDEPRFQLLFFAAATAIDVLGSGLSARPRRGTDGIDVTYTSAEY